MFRILITSIVFMLFLLSGQILADENKSRVLLLISYHPGFPTFFDQIEGIKSGLIESGLAKKDTVVDVEFMDTKRFAYADVVPRFSETLRRKLLVLPPYDVVITADDNATRFAIKNQSSLLENMPIIFLGVNNRKFALAQNDNPLVTGVIEAVSINETLEFIARARPDTDRPTIISDTTPSGQGDLHSLLTIQPKLEQQVLSLETLTHKQLLTSLSKLPPSANILLLSAYRDHTGVLVDFNTHLAQIMKISKAPVFHLWQHGFGEGVFGGVVIDHKEQGRKAGQLAGAVLQGTPINKLKVVEQSPNVTMIDYSLVDKYGVAPSSFPSNTKFINKPIGLYEAYAYEILIVVVSFLLLLSFCWLLSVYVVRLRNTHTRLKESEEKLSRHIMNTPLGCISWDLDFKCTEWNKSAEDIFGYSADEMIGLSPVKTILPPEMKEEIDAVYQSLLAQKGGSRNTNRNITKDGKTVICEWYNTPITNETGEISGVASFVQDITTQKEMEKNLRQSQKMEAVGQLTGGIAHDFNNMLGVIMGNLELLRAKLLKDAKATQYIDQAYKGVERGTKITKKLLNFSRNEQGELQRTNVNDFISGMENLISKSLTPKITIETHLANDVWMTNINPRDFEDTLLNMSLNARDAMPDGGSLIIETSNKILDEPYVLLNPGSVAGEHILVSISDTGAGMTPEVCDQIFLPFFTTKQMGKGTGLGMSMVYGFVQRSGGHIKVYSEAGKGSTFHLFLPKAVEDANSVDLASGIIHEELPRGDESILVVDDEEGLLNVATLYLENLGYRVLTATNSMQALKELQKDNHIDLLFSDVVMPGNMDGYSLGIEVLKKYANIKVLLTSGFTANHQKTNNGDKQLIDKLSRNLLNKPYNLAELAKAVRKALGNDE